MGKSTINGPFSIATLNYQRVSPGALNWIFLRSHPGFFWDDLRLRSPENKDKETLGGTDH
jgi:hypothetical protein